MKLMELKVGQNCANRLEPCMNPYWYNDNSEGRE